VSDFPYLTLPGLSGEGAVMLASAFLTIPAAFGEAEGEGEGEGKAEGDACELAV